MSTLYLPAAPGQWRQELAALATSRAGLLVLDPANSEFGWPGRVVHVAEGKVIAWRFIGGLQVTSDPLGILSFASACLSQQPAGALLPVWKPSPIVRHWCLQMTSMHAWTRLVVAEGSPAAHQPWPLGPELATPEADLPLIAIHAQRRARWIEFLSHLKAGTLPLETVQVTGARLGSGQKLDLAARRSIGFAPETYVEAQGDTLYVVSEQEPDDDIANFGLQFTDTDRLLHVHPRAFSGLLCTVADHENQDRLMGLVDRLDLGTQEFHLRLTGEVAPNLQTLRLGVQKLDEDGREQRPLRPWSI